MSVDLQKNYHAVDEIATPHRLTFLGTGLLSIDYRKKNIVDQNCKNTSLGVGQELFFDHKKSIMYNKN